MRRAMIYTLALLTLFFSANAKNRRAELISDRAKVMNIQVEPLSGVERGAEVQIFNKQSPQELVIRGTVSKIATDGVQVTISFRKQFFDERIGQEMDLTLTDKNKNDFQIYVFVKDEENKVVTPKPIVEPSRMASNPPDHPQKSDSIPRDKVTDWYLEQANEQIKVENYPKAMRYLSVGTEIFPNDLFLKRKLNSVNYIIQLAEAEKSFLRDDPESAVGYLEELYRYYGENTNYNTVGDITDLVGKWIKEKPQQISYFVKLYQIIINYFKAKNDIDNALKYFLLLNDKVQVRDCLKDFSDQFVLAGRIKELESNFIKFNIEMDGDFLEKIGDFHQKKGEFKTALDYYIKSLKSGGNAASLAAKMSTEPVFFEVVLRADKYDRNSSGYWEAEFLNGEITMIFISDGPFFFGNNTGGTENEHKANLPGYWISKYEITVKQYLLFAKEFPANIPDWMETDNGTKQVLYDYYQRMGGKLKDEKVPICGVNWLKANKYCKWLSNRSGFNFRLPSDLEWEKAARGKLGRIYPWGNDGNFNNRVNFCDAQNFLITKNSNADQTVNDGFPFSSPVGSFPQGQSPYGLMDMSGNVWEWTADLFDSKSSSASAAVKRSIRGGSFNSEKKEDLKVFSRGGIAETTGAVEIGFRIVMDKVVEIKSSEK